MAIFAAPDCTHIDTESSMPIPALSHVQDAIERAIFAAEGNPEITAALTDGPNAPDYSRALNLAAAHGYRQCVDLLIPRVDSSWMRSVALCQAATHGHAECVRLLIPCCDRGASTLRALYLAAQIGSAECVGLLMPLFDFSKQASSICDPLWVAARGGHAECVELLLPTVATNGDGASRALCSAAWAGSAECVKLLIPALLFKQKGSSDALLAAAAQGHVDCSKLLIPAAKGRGCLAALSAAAENGHSEVLSLLLAEPAMSSNSVAASLAKSRALVKAARNGHAGAAKLLFPFCLSLLVDRKPLTEALAEGRASVLQAMFEREPLLASAIDLPSALHEARGSQHEELADLLFSVIEREDISSEVKVTHIPCPPMKYRL